MRKVTFVVEQDLYDAVASLPQHSRLLWQNGNYSIGDVLIIKSSHGQEIHKRVQKKEGDGNYCTLYVESLNLLPLAERLQRSLDYFALPLPDCSDLGLQDATCMGYPLLIGQDEEGRGIFLVRGPDGALGDLDSENYLALLEEVKEVGLKSPFHVFARYEILWSSSVIFHKLIPHIFEEMYEALST